MTALSGRRGLTLAFGLVEPLEEVGAFAHVAARVGGIVGDERGAELERLQRRGSCAGASASGFS